MPHKTPTTDNGASIVLSRTYIRNSQICTAVKSLVEGNATLLYRIELGIEGYDDGPPNGLCTSDRLKQLQERRDRWLRLDWSHVIPLTPQAVIPQSPLPYELQGGTFMNVRKHDGQITINKTVLPNKMYTDIEYMSHGLQVNALDITTDPTQDLLVLLDTRGRVHIWSLSTYTAHPRAAQAILRQQGVHDSLQITALYIAHDMVALVEWSDCVCVTIWNWQTGRTIISADGNPLSYLATGLAWLSSRVFVLADASRGELAIFSLHGVDCASPNVTPIHLNNLPPCARLQLPRIDHGWHISHFQLDTTPLSARLPRDRPFSIDPDLNIVVFTLQFVTHNHRQMSSRYMGFVHNRFLMSYVTPRSSGEQPKRNVVPWKDWGPKHSRIMTRCIASAAFARYVYGQKVVYSRNHPIPAKQLISVFDFNVHPTRLPATARTHSEARVHVVEREARLYGGDGTEVYVELVDEATVIKRDSQSQLQYHPFVEDVVSGLPYIETTRFVEGPPQKRAQFMMDEERLIELRLYGEEGPSTDTVRVYTL
ncbi:hypothetical protein C8Q79DRAFT_174423 [Trametes meyenii]|nr:hypothetical protein C8Q79DRAFT_174423 [Trametes meyenii]